MNSIQIGDVVSLFSEQDGGGFLSGDGFADEGVSFMATGDIETKPLNFRDCLFEIKPRLQYEASHELDKALKELGRRRQSFDLRRTMGSQKGLNDVLEEMREKERSEREANAVFAATMLGQCVEFGQVIQLRHVKSNKFVTVRSGDLADVEKNNMRVELDPNGTEGSLFTITPRYKLRSEGDRVLYGDQFILVSTKLKQSLHISKAARSHEDLNMKEVNAATAPAAWRMVDYQTYDPDVQEFLKAGDVVTLFHSETEGFIEVNLTNGEPVLRLSQSHDPPSDFASDSLWSVELDLSGKGGICTWGSTYRLRHLGSRSYLACDMTKKLDPQLLGSQAETEEGIEAYEVVTVSTPTPELCDFVLSPGGFELGARLGKKTIGRLQHKKSKAWFHPLRHVIVDKPSTSKARPRFRVLTRVCLSSKMFDEDGLTLAVAWTRDINELNFVLSVLPILESFVKKLHRGQRVSEEETAQVIAVLKDMIFYCQQHEETDPLKVEGIPIPRRQRLYRDQRVIDIVVDILRTPFITPTQQRKKRPGSVGHGETPTESRVKPWSLDEICKTPHLFLVFKLCNRLLNASFKGNWHIELYLARDIDTFINEVGYDMLTEGMLTNLLDNNARLLDDAVSPETIETFIRLLQTHGKNKKYVKFLAALCSCLGESIRSNQADIANLLLKDKKARHNLLIFMKMENERLLFQCAEIGAGWISWAEFVEYSHNIAKHDLVAYFDSLLQLLAELCFDRFKENISIISRLFPRELVYKAMISRPLDASDPDAELPPQIRASFTRLMIRLYVDVEPMSRINAPRFTRILSKIDDELLEATYTLGDVDDLVSFVISHMQASAGAQYASEVNANYLTQEVLSLCRFLVECGQFQSVDALKRLIAVMSPLLDGRDDYEMRPEVATGPQSTTDRYILNEDTHIIMTTKVQMCQILNLVLDLMEDIQISKFLFKFKDVNENEKPDSLLDPVLARLGSALRVTGQGLRKAGQVVQKVSGGLAGTAVTGILSMVGVDLSTAQGKKPTPESLERQAVLRTILEDTEYLDVDLMCVEVPLIQVLMDLAMYQLPDLVTTAMKLLIRLHNKSRSLVKNFRRVQLLVDDRAEAIYEKALKECRELKRLVDVKEEWLAFKTPSDRNALGRCIALLEGFANMCNHADRAVGLVSDRLEGREGSQYDSDMQNLLRNLGVHMAVIDLCTLHPAVFTRLKKDKELRTLMNTACKFLRGWVHDNKDNQEILFDRIDIFKSFLGEDLRVAKMLTDIVRGNRSLCRRVKEDVVAMIANVVVNRGPKARYLGFMDAIVEVDGEAIRRNQNMVVKALFDAGRFKKTMVLYDGEEGFKKRLDAMDRGDIIDLKSPLNYHVALLHLLAKCCSSKNGVSESKCRGLFELDELLQIIRHPRTVEDVAKAFLHFMTECYVDADVLTANLSHNVEMWNLIDDFLRQVTAIRQYPQTVDEATRSNQELFLDTVIPMLTAFFHKHFKQEECSDEERARAMTVASELSHLHESPPPMSERQGEGLVRCLHVMQDKGLLTAMHKFDIHFMPRRQQNALTEGMTDRYRLFVSSFSDDPFVREEFDDEFRWMVKKFIKEDLAATDIDVTQRVLVHLRHHFDRIDEWTAVNLLNMLSTMVTVYQDEPVKMEAMQNKLDKLGCTLMALDIIKKNRLNKLTIHALKLCIALLEGGNRTVQNTLYEFFVETGEEDFFYEMRQRLRLAATEAMTEKRRLKAFKMRKKRRLILRQDSLARMVGSPRRSGSFFGRRKSFQDEAGVEMTSLQQQQYDDDSSSPEMQRSHSFRESGVIYVLRLLQLFCEGHNTQMQDYLRNQKQSGRSFDLITDTLGFLGALDRHVHYTNVEICIQTLQTITEYVQGCPDNQTLIGASKIYDSCARILRSPFTPRELTNKLLIQKMKRETVTVLSSLLEGRQDKRVHRQIVASLPLNAMLPELETNYEDAKLLPDDDRHPFMELGFRIYILVRMLEDFDSSWRDAVDPQKRKKDFGGTDSSVNPYKFFQKAVGSIEVVKDEHLERVYFVVPPISDHLTHTTMMKFIYTVPRESPDQKVEEFIKASDAMMDEMVHQERISKYPILPFLARHNHHVRDFSLLLAFAINILILVFFEAPDTNVPHGPLEDVTIDGTPNTIIRILGFFQTAASLLSLLFYYVNYGPLIVAAGFKRWGAITGNLLGGRAAQEQEEAQDGDVDLDFDMDEKKPVLAKLNPLSVGNALVGQATRNVGALLNIVLHVYFCLLDPTMLYYVVYVAFTLMGNFVSAFFFAFHLVDVVVRSETLKNVIRAVTYNGKSLLMTAFLGVIIIYYFSIVAFHFLRFYFLFEVDLVNEEWSCDTMLECFFTTFNQGLRNGGGIGDVLFQPPITEDDKGPYFVRFAYDMLFFFIVIIILLNIIFGIIIDTFADLRDQRNVQEDDIRNHCFMCNIDRFTFDREGDGFERHIKLEHNMWSYLNFMVYLRLRDRTEFNGAEQYVHDLLAENDTSWVPLHKAMSLDTTLKEEDSMKELASRVDAIGGDIIEIRKLLQNKER